MHSQYSQQQYKQEGEKRQPIFLKLEMVRESVIVNKRLLRFGKFIILIVDVQQMNISILQIRITKPIQNYNCLPQISMFKQQEDWDYSRYLDTEEQIHLSDKAIQYFRLLDDIVRKRKKPVENSVIPLKLLKAFSCMSKQQQTRYICQNLKYLSHMNKLGKNKLNFQQNSYVLCKQPKIIIVKCEKKKNFLCFYPPTMTLKLETVSRTLLVNDQNYLKLIDLQNYLVHQGNKMFKNVLQLQPIVQSKSSWQELKSYKFTLPEKEYHKIYDEIFNCIMDIRNQQLAELFISSNQLGDTVANQKQNKFINKTHYEQFLNFKKRILEQGIKYLKYQNKLYQQSYNKNYLTIYQHAKKTNLFKLQIFSDLQDYQLKQKFLDVIQNSKNALMIESELLETYQSTCVALLQKYYLSSKPVTTIYMREILSLTDMLFNNKLSSITSIQDMKRYDDFLFMKALPSPMTDNFINFLLAFVTTIPNNKMYKSCLMIIADFNINPKLNVQMVQEFLTQYYYCIFNRPRKNQIDMAKKQSHKMTNIENPKTTYSSSTDKNSKPSQNSQQNQKQVMVQFDQPQKALKVSRFKFKSSEQMVSQKLTSSFLHHKFELYPMINYNVKKNLVNENFMHGQWKKGKDGGLICTNQKLLNQQKKIIKHVMTSMGSNLIKGTNILNVSLPVTIFKKKGHPQIVADSFSIAPILFQNQKNLIERIKKSIIFSIGVGTLGISSEKPFFPTLGQTLQVWIGGCPFYIEQILRYPPTEQYMFYGRGYKIIGQIQPKISMGLNGGKGYSQRPSYIVFDDGQKIQLAYAKLSINGLIVGQREFNFEQKAFVYDKQNNIFAQIIFGARDTKIFGKNQQTKDFVYGKIYQVQPEYAQKFQSRVAPRIYPSKKQIKNVISSFQGYWDGIIQFDGKQYINFETDLPCVVQQQQFALPSDTRFRPDLVNLINNNIQQAQRQKQVIQQSQRRDRRLRQQWQKKR